MSLKKQALSGVFWTAMQQFGGQGISFFVSIILARLLTPEEFGLIGMIGILMGIGTTLVNAGLGQSLIRTSDPSQEDYSTVFFFNLVGSIVLYFIAFLIAPIIARFYNQDILINIIRIYCLTFIINAFSTIQNTRLTKLLDFKTQFKVTIPSLIISGLCAILMAYNNYGVWTLVYMPIIGSFASAIQLWFWSKWRPVLIFSKEKFKLHFSFGFKLTLSAILNIFFINIYIILIGKFFSATQVGYFTRADSLKQLPANNILNILNRVTYPLFSKIKDDNVRLKSSYKKIIKMVVFIIAPVLIFMAVLAEPLFRFLFTEKWLPAVPYFQILCVNGILGILLSFNLNILKVKGRSDIYLKLEVINKIIMLLVIIISFQFGIYGLLYGSILCSLIAFFINTYFSGKLLNYNTAEQLKDIIPTILIAIVAGGLIMVFDNIFIKYNKLDLLRCLLGIIIGIISYLSIMYILKILSIKELYILLKKEDKNI